MFRLFSTSALAATCLALLALGEVSRAAEVDNFTDRDKIPDDGTEQVNKQINAQIRLALEKVKDVDCTKSGAKDKLIEALGDDLDTNFPKARENLWKSEECPMAIRKEIYEDMEDSGVLMSAGACCDPVINVNGHRIGVDKMDHSLSAGFIYYKAFKEGKSIDDLAKMGTEFEEGMWGLAGTGVKSYGDMAANYSGFLMYRDMLDGDNPNIQCVDGKFALKTEVNYAKYVDDALDESINCSSYRTEKAAKKFAEKIGKATGGKQCPVEPGKCQELAASAKYKAVAKYVLHPNCLNPEKKGVPYEEGMSFPRATYEMIKTKMLYK